MDSFFNMVDVQTVLFIYLAVGFFCRKRGIFTDEARDKLTDFVVLVTLPCMIFESFNMAFSLEALKEICRRFMELGVKEVTCIHSREVGVYYDKAGNFTWSPAVNLPKGYIKGAVGAGDAFCAGMLYSFYKGFSAKQALDVASCTAGCNLSAPDSVSGMKPLAEALELLKIYGSETL